MVHKLPDAIKIRVTARVGRSRVLEAVLARRKRVYFALNAHAAQLFPDLHGRHRGIPV